MFVWSVFCSSELPFWRLLVSFVFSDSQPRILSHFLVAIFSSVFLSFSLFCRFFDSGRCCFVATFVASVLFLLLVSLTVRREECVKIAWLRLNRREEMLPTMIRASWSISSCVQSATNANSCSHETNQAAWMMMKKLQSSLVRVFYCCSFSAICLDFIFCSRASPFCLAVDTCKCGHEICKHKYSFRLDRDSLLQYAVMSWFVCWVFQFLLLLLSLLLFLLVLQWSVWPWRACLFVGSSCWS